MSRTHHVTVSPLPHWVDPQQYLGLTHWHTSDGPEGFVATATLDTHHAADVAARLRGLGLNGYPLNVACQPPLNRKAIRDGRTLDARRRRHTTPGFTKKTCQSDAPSRMGLTPESIAFQMAKGLKNAVVFDACGGIGGNAIGFARNGATVLSTETNGHRLSMARQNARIYGVASKIQFHQMDARSFKQEAVDICFVDPPWGPDWDKKQCALSDFPLAQDLWKRFLKHQQWMAFWLKVPSSFVPNTLHPLATTEPVFGTSEGDKQRIKFLLIKVPREVLRPLPQ